MSKTYAAIAVAALAGWLVAKIDFPSNAHAQATSASGYGIACTTFVSGTKPTPVCGIVNNSTGKVTSCNLNGECQAVGKAE